MEKSEIILKLRTYFIQDVLDGKDTSLDETTPLLEWGIINSFEMVRLVSYIRSDFGVDIPYEAISADHFTDILTIANLICEQGQYVGE